MSHKPLCGDPAHGKVGILDPLPAVVAQRKGKRLSDLIGGSRAKMGRRFVSGVFQLVGQIIA